MTMACTRRLRGRDPRYQTLEVVETSRVFQIRQTAEASTTSEVCPRSREGACSGRLEGGVLVHHRGRGMRKVGAHCGAGGLRDSDLVDSGEHMRQPGIALGGADREGGVAHTQAWVTAALAIGCGAAEILDEEEQLVLLTGLKVGGKERAQQGVALDAGIERIDQTSEGGGAASLLEDRVRIAHNDTVSQAGRSDQGEILRSSNCKSYKSAVGERPLGGGLMPPCGLTKPGRGIYRSRAQGWITRRGMGLKLPFFPFVAA